MPCHPQAQIAMPNIAAETSGMTCPICGLRLLWRKWRRYALCAATRRLEATERVCDRPRPAIMTCYALSASSFLSIAASAG